MLWGVFSSFCGDISFLFLFVLKHRDLQQLKHKAGMQHRRQAHLHFCLSASMLGPPLEERCPGMELAVVSFLQPSSSRVESLP